MEENNVKKFCIDGAGQGPDGTGSGYAWVRPGTDKQRVIWEDSLTNNQAEYKALLTVTKYVAKGSHLVISTDSMLVSEQFNRRWAVNDPELARLLSAVREMIDNKGLDVKVKWIPRELNLAGKLLERKGR